MNMYNKLFVWVEGPDDTRFFKNAIEPLFTPYFDKIIIKEYAVMAPSLVNKILATCKGTDKCYIFQSDIDDNKKDANWKKRKVIEKYEQLDEDNIIVTVTEIESWYLAGLDKAASEKLNINYLNNTDKITKEDFCRMMPSRFDSKIDLMLEILKEFNIATAKNKNNSLNFFLTDFYSNFIPKNQ
jgi:hypothetical protein